MPKNGKGRPKETREDLEQRRMKYVVAAVLDVVPVSKKEKTVWDIVCCATDDSSASRS